MSLCLGTANELNYIPKESITRGVITVSSILGKANLFEEKKMRESQRSPQKPCRPRGIAA